MEQILKSKIHGSLAAASIADALGAPTEELSRNQLQAAFGEYVVDFHAPLPTAPYAKGRAAGQITDDSSQMLMLAELLSKKGADISPRDIADLLIEWSKKEEYYPHFAGPSTRAAIDRLARGEDPWEVGRDGKTMMQGTSNGAAMRIAPVGLFHHGDPEAAARTAFLTCVPSHNTSVAVAGAAAIAAAVSEACRDGASVLDIVRAAKLGARVGHELGRSQGREVPASSIEARIERAAMIAMSTNDDNQAIERISDEIGVGLPAAEAVPAAVGFFVAAGGAPIRTAQLAANAGGDSDTIGCMAAAIAGAYVGIEGVDESYIAKLEQANDVDIARAAANLSQAAIGKI